MRGEQEILEQLEKVLVVANGEPGPHRELARNISHLLGWVLGETDYMPPSGMFGWISTSVAEISEAAGKTDPAMGLTERVLRAIRDIALRNLHPGLSDDRELNELATEMLGGSFLPMTNYDSVLLIPFDEGDPKLEVVPRSNTRSWGPCSRRTVSREVAERVICSRDFRRMAEHSEGHFPGWREIGLPGEKGELYCLAQ